LVTDFPRAEIVLFERVLVSIAGPAAGACSWLVGGGTGSCGLVGFAAADGGGMVGQDANASANMNPRRGGGTNDWPTPEVLSSEILKTIQCISYT
jgi:hypothetical protein